MGSADGAAGLHAAVELRLAGLDQRYTPARRVLVGTVAAAAGPVTIADILVAAPDLPPSSAYRNVSALVEAGVLRRVNGSDERGRVELAERWSAHHHHLVCQACGRVDDIAASPRLEQALGDAARAVAAAHGYRVSDHQLDLVGTCPGCRGADPAPTVAPAGGLP